MFLTVDAHNEVIDMSLTLGRVEDALRHGKRQMKANEMEKLYISFAKKSEKKPTTRTVVEKIYLGLKNPELAIEMYTAAGDMESVVRLTSLFGGDVTQLAAMATSRPPKAATVSGLSRQLGIIRQPII
jgi:intraflagellar transport protein 172